nr:FABP family protein [Corynebacterium lactis]
MNASTNQPNFEHSAASAAPAANGAPSLHPALEPLADLLGTWKGSGHGKYSTIKDFDYLETVSLTPLPGKPFVRMENRSATPEGQPQHMELGFIRSVGEGKVEVIMAQATGQAEVLYGTITRTETELRIDAISRSVTNTDTAKTVDETQRSLVLELADGVLTNSFGMAAVGKQMENHLVSRLKRVEER